MSRDPLARDPRKDPRPGDVVQGPVIGLKVITVTEERTEDGVSVTQVRCALYAVKTGKAIGSRSFTLDGYRSFTAGSENVEVLHVAQD